MAVQTQAFTISPSTALTVPRSHAQASWRSVIREPAVLRSRVLCRMAGLLVPVQLHYDHRCAMTSQGRLRPEH